MGNGVAISRVYRWCRCAFFSEIFISFEEKKKNGGERASDDHLPFLFEIKQARWLIIIIVEQARAVRYCSFLLVFICTKKEGRKNADIDRTRKLNQTERKSRWSMRALEKNSFVRFENENDEFSRDRLSRQRIFSFDRHMLEIKRFNSKQISLLVFSVFLFLSSISLTLSSRFYFFVPYNHIHWHIISWNISPDDFYHTLCDATNRIEQRKIDKRRIGTKFPIRINGTKREKSIRNVFF